MTGWATDKSFSFLPPAILESRRIDESLLRTNPHWCIEQIRDLLDRPGMLDQFVALLRSEGIAVRHDVGDPPVFTPGVVGLLVDRHEGHGFVTPLRATLAPQWHVAPNLPFTAVSLQHALGRLLTHFDGGLALVQPDLLAFRVEDLLGEKPDGTSLTIAAVLAIVGEVSTGRHPLLACACAVVEPDWDGDGLHTVQGIPSKLGAFVREYGRGTLLVRHPDCAEAAQYDAAFAQVWKVRSFGDLFRCLNEAGLMDPFRGNVPLDRHRLEIAVERLRVMMDTENRYLASLDLAYALSRHAVAADVPYDARRQVQQAIVDLCRHLGRYNEAIRAARAEYRRVHRPGAATCHDEQARLAVFYAASLYDPHRFQEMVDLLRPWQRRLARVPRLISPEAQIMVQNTLSRALIALGEGGWRMGFERSTEILKKTNSFDLARTWNYWIQGALKAGCLDEAERLIRRSEALGDMSLFSRWVLRTNRADLARRRGQTWSDPEMEQQQVRPGVVGHPFGIYFQVTARQPGRDPLDAAARFQRARDFFLLDLDEADQGNILVFQAACMCLARAAVLEDCREWGEGLQSLRTYLKRRDSRGFRAYYRQTLAGLGTQPSYEAAEYLLARAPHL
jgi:hypothetical protein